jgi:hypothetical protein
MNVWGLYRLGKPSLHSPFLTPGSARSIFGNTSADLSDVGVFIIENEAEAPEKQKDRQPSEV